MNRSHFYFANSLWLAFSMALACDNASTAPVDGATCDCSQAEPRLEGRITIRESGEAVTAMSTTFISNACETGELLLTGGCRLLTPNSGVVLEEAGIGGAEGNSWGCSWHNTSNTDDVGYARIKCLAPAAP